MACPWRSLGCSYVGRLNTLTTHKKQCVMNPDLLPEALREREVASLKRSQSEAMMSMLTGTPFVGPSATSSVDPSPVAVVDDADASGDNEDDEEDGDMAPAPPPSLLMRLFHNGAPSDQQLLTAMLSSGSPSRPQQQPVRRPSKRSRSDAF